MLKDWLPTSKMTAVLVAGVTFVAGAWLLLEEYGLKIETNRALAGLLLTQAWFIFWIGYSVTERRGDGWKD
jgi:hypothetical protein